jgi:predicted metal-dependent HD superfamily phosphohydrolase
MLKETFTALAKTYTTDNDLVEELWSELETTYSGKKRHYHTLAHLENLIGQLSIYKEQIADWNCMLFAVFYHDAIYNVMKKDNEEKSAELAEARMRSLAVPSHIIQRCKQHILATKAHTPSADADTNLFTDADLSVLGMSWEVYLNYCRQVRKEYSIFPDMLYNPGRKKALTHFLEMEHIYKTDAFRGKYEANAKQNLSREISEVLK